MNPSPEIIEAALLDVRRAFRLIYQYNQRVRDVSEIIARLTEWSPSQTFSMTPISTRRPVLGGWSTWDCTPTNDWIFLYASPKARKKPMCLAVWFCSDSGFADSDGGDPAAFPAADQCKSDVTLVLFVAKEGKAPVWSTVWFDSDEWDAENGMLVSCVYPGTAREVRFVWRSLPISELRDEASVRDLVNAFLEESSGALGERLESVRSKR